MFCVRARSDCLENTSKIVGFQRGATNKATIDIGLGKHLRGIISLYTAAVK